MNENQIKVAQEARKQDDSLNRCTRQYVCPFCNKTAEVNYARQAIEINDCIKEVCYRIEGCPGHQPSYLMEYVVGGSTMIEHHRYLQNACKGQFFVYGQKLSEIT